VGKFSSSKDIWDKLHNIYSMGSLLVITEPEHASQDKEDVEERISSCQTNPEEEIGNGMVDHEENFLCSLES
jgi:hypothetical protein